VRLIQENVATNYAEFQVVLWPEEHAYLLDHQVKGIVVLPMVEVIDWFYQVLTCKIGSVPMYQLNDFQVMSGIKLGAFKENACMTIRQEDNTLSLFFKEKLSYRAHYSLTNTQQQNPPLLRSYQHSWPWTAAEIYRKNLLFHGQTYQVIHELLGVDSAGCMGVLHLKTPENSQAIDKLLLDGGLQLACLWIRWLLKKASLPMRIGSITCQLPLKQASLITCILTGTIKDKVRGLIDLQFFDNHQLIAQFSALEMLVYEE
jgi:hypothetical protein